MEISRLRTELYFAVAPKCSEILSRPECQSSRAPYFGATVTCTCRRRRRIPVTLRIIKDDWSTSSETVPRVSPNAMKWLPWAVLSFRRRAEFVSRRPAYIFIAPLDTNEWFVYYRAPASRSGDHRD